MMADGDNADALMLIMARIPRMSRGSMLARLMAWHSDDTGADNKGQMLIDNLDRAKVNHGRDIEDADGVDKAGNDDRMIMASHSDDKNADVGDQMLAD
jgi:hypothetical protein